MQQFDRGNWREEYISANFLLGYERWTPQVTPQESPWHLSQKEESLTLDQQCMLIQQMEHERMILRMRNLLKWEQVKTEIYGEKKACSEATEQAQS